MPESNNLIQIEGSSYLEIKRAIIDWLDSNTSQLASDFKIELVQYGKNSFDLNIDKRIDSMLFCFLTNYLQYPVGMTYVADIKGYKRFEDSERILPEQSKQHLVVFVHLGDKEFDNVHVINDQNQIWKIGFDGKVEKEDLNFHYSTPLKRESRVLKSEGLIVKKKEGFKKRRAIRDSSIPKKISCSC